MEDKYSSDASSLQYTLQDSIGANLCTRFTIESILCETVGLGASIAEVVALFLNRGQCLQIT